MRTYSEEKRSGTIELLLTSPVTDVEIILGKFLGAMALYAAMLAITVIHMLLLFSYANPKPEWTVPVIGYVGLLLMGGCFISVGLLISSLTKNQIVSGMVTFAVFLLLWVINWIASFTGPTTQSVLNYLSITDHFDDFTSTLVTREQQLGRVLDSFATTAAVLAEERGNIERLVKALGQLSVDGLDLVAEHRVRLQHDVEVLTRTLLSVQTNIESVRQLLSGYYELEVGASGETIWVPMAHVVPE
jgi:ABC-type transport system involved in multi-copper enzyme maturation permease subunit